MRSTARTETLEIGKEDGFTRVSRLFRFNYNNLCRIQQLLLLSLESDTALRDNPPRREVGNGAALVAPFQVGREIITNT